MRSALLRCTYRFSRRSYERIEVEFRYNTKTAQENLYQKLLKLIRDLIISKAKSQLKICLSLIEPKSNKFKNL